MILRLLSKRVNQKTKRIAVHTLLVEQRKHYKIEPYNEVEEAGGLQKDKNQLDWSPSDFRTWNVQKDSKGYFIDQVDRLK